MLHRVDIFGEYHDDEDRTRIEKILLERHKEHPYQFILSEEAGDGVYLTEAERNNAIKREIFSIGPRSYMLGNNLDLPVIGIDEWDEKKFDIAGERISTKLSFKIREARMLSVIKTYMAKGSCAVLIGDSHLRTVFTPELGEPSKLQSLARKDGVTIFRSPKGEIK